MRVLQGFKLLKNTFFYAQFYESAYILKKIKKALESPY